MRQFLDLPGQSGAAYRFRLWPQDQPHVPVGGNYVFVREGAAGVEVRVIGVTPDLSRARATFPAAKRGGATHVYTRLNVSRAAREAEHQDLVARHGKARVEGGEP